MVNDGYYLVSWTIVCAPKELGGLGVPHLPTMGYALRMRWEWLRRWIHTVWVDLPCQSEFIIKAMFEASLTVRIGDGSDTFFWTHKWINGNAIKDLVPILF